MPNKKLKITLEEALFKLASTHIHGKKNYLPTAQEALEDTATVLEVLANLIGGADNLKLVSREAIEDTLLTAAQVLRSVLPILYKPED